MSEYWKVLCHTYIFGGNTSYQTTDKTAREILDDHVSNPDLWIKKAQDGVVKSGRIYKDHLTYTLKDYVGAVTVYKGCTLIEIVLGSGALLGGMDQKITYTPIEKDQYDRLKALITDFKKYDDLVDDVYYDKHVKKDLARSLLTEEQQKEYDDHFERQDTEERLLSIIRPKCSPKERKAINEPATLALLKKKSNLTKKVRNEFPLVCHSLDDLDTPTFNPDILKGKLGLKQLGYSTRNIATIHYSTLNVPHLLVMKDGRQIFAAPRIEHNQPNFLGDLLDKVRKTKQDKESELKTAFMAA